MERPPNLVEQRPWSSVEQRRMDPLAEYAPGGKPKPLAQPGKIGKPLRIAFIPWQADTIEAEEWLDKCRQWNARKNNKFDIICYDPGEKAQLYLTIASNYPGASIYFRGHGGPGAQGIMTKRGDMEAKTLLIEDACERLIGMGLKPTFAGAIKFHFCYSGTVPTDEAFDDKVRQAMTHVHTLEHALDYKKGEVASASKDVRAARSWPGADLLRTPQEKARAEQELAEAKEEKARLKSELAMTKTQLRDREWRVPGRVSLAARGAAYMRKHGFKQCTYYGYLGPLESYYGAVDTAPADSDDPRDWHKYTTLEGLHDMPEALRQHVHGEGADAKFRARASTARVRIP